MLGFLFGIPKVQEIENTASSKVPVEGAQDNATDRQAVRQVVNTNLEQISDWLTKIIVGLGLVQLNTVPHFLWLIAGVVGGGISGGSSQVSASIETRAFACSLIIYFTIVGFLGGYLLTRLFLQRAFYLGDNMASSSIEAEIKVDTALRFADVEVGKVRAADFYERIMEKVGFATPLQATPDAIDAANQVIANFDAALPANVDKLKVVAKAYYVLGRLADAEQTLRTAIERFPNDADALFFLCSVMLSKSGNELSAIPLLQKLIKLPAARIAAWKLLGYALLFSPNSLNESEAATSKYLEAVPDDAGAKLNLACVFGQRYSKDKSEENKSKAIQLIREVIAVDPSWIDIIKNLNKRGEDFADLDLADVLPRE